jgi:NitT/TauT family transport system substrate-binding protein
LNVSSNKSFSSLVFILALTSQVALAATAPAQLSLVSIAYTSISPQYSPVWIAKDAGIFKKNGINAELVYMRGGVLATQALVSSDVQFINAGGGGVVDAVLGGADIFIIASPMNQEPQVLITRKDIKEPSQLKGRKIAVNSLAGPSILSLKMILAALGLDPDKDVSFLATGPSASRFGALSSGMVDATSLAPPFTLAARKAGYNFFDNIPGLKEAELPNAAMITSKKVFEAQPVVTEMVVKSMIEGIHFCKTEKPKTIAILKKYMKLENAEELEETYSYYVKLIAEKPYPTAKSIQTILDWSKRPDARSASPGQFIQPKIVEKLDKQGFIDSLYKR